jgi:hypothetical protein
MSHGLPVMVEARNPGRIGARRKRLTHASDEEDPLALAEALSDPQRLREKGRASYRIVANEVNGMHD